MFRYVAINSDSNTNSQAFNKKNQKTLPISLLSGGNSFFVKIKSNQIASNYNDTSNKIKPALQQKINTSYFHKENKNKSYNKCIINSQQKNSYIFKNNNSIDYNYNINIKKSIVNKSKQDLFNHNKGIYSFTSMINNDINNNKSTINTDSFRQNYNGVLLTDVELLKKNVNKNFNIYEENKENKKNPKEKNSNNYNYQFNKKIFSSKNQYNNNIIYDSSINKKIKSSNEKNIVLTTKNKNINNNNQIKLYKKNQYIMKNNNNYRNNNRNNLRNKNLTNILFNNNSSIEKSKLKNSIKNNCSEGKNKVIIHGQKKNKLLGYKELSNNNTNIFKDHFLETDEYNNSISRRKNVKKIKSINIKQNSEALKIQKNSNNSKSNFNTINNNNKSLLLQKKLFEKNNTHHIITKNNNINKNTKIINSFTSGELFNKLNYTLNELIEPNSNNYKNKKNKQINHNENKRDLKMGKKYLISDLNTYNIDKMKINNCPNIIINNNYLYNYIPLVTLNNSVNDDNVKRISLNRNSFIENRTDNKNYNINNSQNFKIDREHTYILNYNSFIEKNSKVLNNNTMDNDNKSKINKKYKNYSKQNIIEKNTKNNIINKINNIYNLNQKFINSSAIDNISRINRNDMNLCSNRSNSNNIVESYVSKEKNKKQKQNPPLSKNPKKLNILSLIQENNRKIKDSNNRRQHQFHSFVETDNFNKCYNNKNVYETIDYVLYPENYKKKDDIEVLDNFDDMNTIIRRINFENVDLKTTNIFTVNDSKNTGKKIDNYWYAKFSESFNNSFDKKYLNRKNNLSATQNKIKNNHNLYHSRQSGSTRDSNKENSSIKKYRVFSYLDKNKKNN